MNIQKEYCRNIYISIIHILNYFGNSKRPIREGEQVLKAGMVYAIGLNPNSRKSIINGLVIQTSALSAKPHEVKLKIIKNCDYQTWDCSCSCKAGKGQKCKHIAACLLHINREPELKAISCTEIQQKWGKIGRSVPKKYSGLITDEMCHCRKRLNWSVDEVTEDHRKQFFSMFIKASPNSELAKLIGCYRSIPVSVESQSTNSEYNEFFKFLINHTGLKNFVSLMENFKDQTETLYFLQLKKSVEESVTICKETMSQTGTKWLSERNKRITGSIAYQLYTYAKNRHQDWNKKLNSIYNNTFKGNKNTRYGTYAEKLAKQVYGHRCLLFECGLI